MSSDILFLEDDEAQLIIYRNLFVRNFPNLSASFTGRVSEAEKILKTNQIKLAVVDLMIPVINGADLIMKIKADCLFSGIKIVVVTAAEKGSLLYDALGGVVDEIVTKPISADEFVALLSRHLD